MMQDAGVEHATRRWLGFSAWVVVGTVVCLGSLVFPTLGLVLLAATVVVLLTKPLTRRSAFGVLVGAGLPLLYVAWSYRSGAGWVCSYTPSSTSCGQYPDPWPWLIAGIALIIVGIVAHLLRSLRG